MRAIAPVLTSVALLTALTGCTAATDLVSAATGVDLGSMSGGTRINGRVYGPANQVALVAAGGGNLVAAGGGNYQLFARSDETTVNGAKVLLDGGGAATTDNAGKFSLEVAPNKVYKTTVVYGLKAGGSATLTAVAVMGAGTTNIDFDCANYMVAAKAYVAGKATDGAKLNEAITKMRSAMQSVSAVPTFTDTAGAVNAFDANASAEVKAALGI